MITISEEQADVVAGLIRFSSQSAVRMTQNEEGVISISFLMSQADINFCGCYRHHDVGGDEHMVMCHEHGHGDVFMDGNGDDDDDD